MTATRQEQLRPARWAPYTLRIDGGWLVLVGIMMIALTAQGYSGGSGPYGALRGSPFVIGFATAFLMIAVIGAGLIVGSARPHRPWHVLGILVHVALAVADLTFLDLTTQLFGPSPVVAVELVCHAVFIAAHTTAIVRRDR